MHDKFGRLLYDRVGSYDSATVGPAASRTRSSSKSHAGAVGGATPSVTYAHEDGFYNNTRLTAMTNPNGRVVQMGYGTTGGRGDLLSRVASLKIQGELQDAVTYRFAGTKRRSLFNAMFWEELTFRSEHNNVPRPMIFRKTILKHND